MCEIHISWIFLWYHKSRMYHVRYMNLLKHGLGVKKIKHGLLLGLNDIHVVSVFPPLIFVNGS
jgi:hypothetical protein